MLQMHELRSRERLLLSYNGRRQQKNGPVEFSTGPVFRNESAAQSAS